MTNIYQKILREAASLPERKPRTYQPVKLRDRIKRVLTKPIADVASSTYDVIVGSAFHHRTIEKKVPIDSLSERFAMHCAKLVHAAMIDCDLPVRVMVVDKWTAFFDVGNGRVLELSVSRIPHASKEQAAIVVKESEMHDPWSEIFDQIPESQKITSANVVNDAGITKELRK